MTSILKGTPDVTRYVVLRDSTTGAPKTGYTIANLDLQYTRNRTAPAAKADATALAATDTAHTDNRAIEVDATSSPGLYRIDWPDAAFATGVDKVILVVSGTGIDPAYEDIELVDFSLQGQSAIDLKDFADDGYDPSTNKVAGVVLVDTLTTYTGNTPQTGDSYPIVNSGTHGNANLKTVLDTKASEASVTSIQNNTRVVRVVPDVVERPDSGTTTYRVELLLYDEVGNMEAPDSAPTIALVNQAGTDRSSRLDSTTMALVSSGRYRAIYTASVGDTLEQLVWTFSVVEGGQTRSYGNNSLIVDTTAVDFTAADRAKLDTLHDTRLTSARAGYLDVLNKLDSGLEQDGPVWRGTANFLEQAPAGGGGGATISPLNVDADHTWHFDAPSQTIAPNNIDELIGFGGILAMDFTEPMPARSSISSISATTVTDVGGATEPVISSSAVSANKKQVHLTVTTSSATAGTYTFNVTIVTTDSQTIKRQGRLVLS